MRTFLILIQTALLTINNILPQGIVQITMPKNTIRFEIKPSNTDKTIKNANTPHLVLYDPSIKQGKLLLFLPGSNGIAENGPIDLFATAIQLGYRVISLSYINTPAVHEACAKEELEKDNNCGENFRIKRIYGENTTSVINDEPQDAIMNRFTKLLMYLAEDDKKGNWDMYLDNGNPKWEQIAVCGQSQGGAMACFIAKKLLVARVISFSGGTDRNAQGKLADWYFQKSITPPALWHGAYNKVEPTAALIARSFKILGIPSDHIYEFNSEVRSNKKAHGEGIRNTAYRKQWIELLGLGN
jgi:hypothetical protein